jgi:hypothetical protein
VKEPAIRTWHFGAMAVLVTLAAGAVGWFFGSLANLQFIGTHVLAEAEERPLTDGEREAEMRAHWLGPLLGGASGVATGLAWSWLMVRRARRSPKASLVGRGALLGLAAGAASTAVLHGGLGAAVGGPFGLGSLAGGLVFGLPAGAVVGAFGGWGCEFARRLAAAPAEEAAP